MKKHVCMLLALMLTLWVCCAVAENSVREETQEPVIRLNRELEPGGHYNIDEDFHTEYQLCKSGTYYLSGSTTYNNLYIWPPINGSVTVVLENGLFISETDSITQRPAISIGNRAGATVTLEIAKGAQVYLQGTGHMPAIQKFGLKTKLIIKTSDGTNTGKLTLKAGENAPALGNGHSILSSNSPSGNIYFESGTIVATADNERMPGIGSGDDYDFIDVHFEGADVTATGNPGIGCGRTDPLIGTFKAGKLDVVFDSGKITAKATGNSPGIGCMNGEGGEAKITVNGGEIRATGHGDGPAIGGMTGTQTKITINGGEVTALIDKSGVAIGNNNNYYKHSHYPETIKPAEIFINGGRIDAINRSSGYGSIGGFTDKYYNDPLDTVKIEGGTISTASISASGVIINGGSVYTTSGVSNPKRTQGGTEIPVYEAAVSLDQGTGISDPVQQLFFSDEKLNYGLKDVYSIDMYDSGNLFLYLPVNTAANPPQPVSVVRVAFPDAQFRGYVPATQAGKFYRVHTITIDGNGNGEDNALTHIAYGETRPDSFSNALRAGYHLLGYNIYPIPPLGGNGRILGLSDDSDRNAVCLPNTKYTDGKGQWTLKADTTLYAEWEKNNVTLTFDAAAPESATSKPTGKTDDLTGYSGDKVALPACGFKLKGYRFDAWKGPGTSPKTYDAGENYTIPAMQADTVLTFKALWDPLPYKIRFVSDTSGTVYEQNMVFDLEADLDANPFPAPNNYVFYGWQKINDPEGTVYHDGDPVKNLCDYKGSTGTCEGWTLKALWMENGSVRVSVTLDDTPLSGLQCDLEGIDNSALIPLTYSSKLRCYVPQNDKISVPFGTYRLIIRNDNRLDTAYQSVRIDAGSTGIAHFDYYTVLFNDGAHCVTTVEDHPVGAAFVTWYGDALTARTVVSDAGYTFGGYRFEGSVPSVTVDGDKRVLTVKGKTTVTSVARANAYTLRFHANGGAGTMDELTCEYDRTYTLPLRSFTRKNHRFACWTLTPAWSGKTLTDGASFRNLTDVDGAVIDLYAQWSPECYYIIFHDTGYRNSPANMTQKCYFDTETRLLDTGFSWEEHTLLGWNTKEDGSGTAFTLRQTVKNLVDTPESVIHLYTQWGAPAYVILSQGDRWTHDSTATLSLTTDGPATSLAEVWIDGTPVGMEHYSISGDPLRITLSADFLDTLETGDHTLALKFIYCVTPAVDFTVLPPVYHITEGTGSHWLNTSPDPLVFRSDGPLAKFRQLIVDGQPLDETLYRRSEGSTIITLPAATLRDLGAGPHTIRFKYAWCETETATFFIDTRPVPVTGDTFPLLPFLCLFAAGAGGLILLCRKCVKENRPH